MDWCSSPCSQFDRTLVMRGLPLIYLYNKYRLREKSRHGDIVARYGGDEFLAFLPKTGMLDAAVFATRLQEGIGESPFLFHGALLNVSVSIGFCSTVGLGIYDVASVLEVADKSMYYEKHLKKLQAQTPAAVTGKEGNKLASPSTD